MSYIDDLNQAAAEALAASSSATDSAQIMFDVANGADNVTVTTDGGEVKTVAKAIKDIVDSIEAGVEAPQVEPQTLSGGQTTVTLSTMTTEGIALYIEGSREFDFTVTNDTDFELSQNFPDGTRIWIVKRDIEGTADSFTVTTSTGTQTLSNSLDSRGIWVEDLAALKAIPLAGLVANQNAEMTTTGRKGSFTWMAGDKSANVAADPKEGVWVSLNGDDGSNGAWLRLYNRWAGILPEWMGALHDGVSDDSAAIQSADDYAALSGGIVRFADSDSFYLISNKINKSDFTLWEGSRPSSLSSDLGSTIKSDIDGLAIEVIPSGTTTYNQGAGFKNLGIYGDESNPSGAGISYDLSATPGAAREQMISNVKIAGFVLYNIKHVGGGTYYYDRVFSFRSEKSLWMVDVADSWFYACHFGSGKSFSNPNSAATAGVLAAGASGCNNLTFDSCRFQVCLNGIGFDGDRLSDTEFSGCYWDGNDQEGMQLSDFKTITIRGGRMFNNGTTGAKKRGLLVFSTSGNIAEGLRVIGTMFRDSDKGGPGEVQEGGISFVNNGNGLNDISLSSLDCTEVSQPLQNLALATEVKISDCSPNTTPEFRTQGDSDLTWTYGTHGKFVNQNTTLTADRSITMSTGATPTGFRVFIRRRSGGAFDLNIYKKDGVTLLKTLATDEWANVAYDGSDWVLTEFGSL